MHARRIRCTRVCKPCAQKWPINRFFLQDAVCRAAWLCRIAGSRIRVPTYREGHSKKNRMHILHGLIYRMHRAIARSAGERSLSCVPAGGDFEVPQVPIRLPK